MPGPDDASFGATGKESRAKVSTTLTDHQSAKNESKEAVEEDIPSRDIARINPDGYISLSSSSFLCSRVVLGYKFAVSCSVRVENLQTVHTRRQELHLWQFR